MEIGILIEKQGKSTIGCIKFEIVKLYIAPREITQMKNKVIGGQWTKIF